MAFKYVLPALALAGSALAQCGTGGDFTLMTANDITQLQGCTTYTGNIIVDQNATGTIALTGLRQITGDFRVVGAKDITSITGPELQSIGGSFHLEGLITLSNLQMDYLTSVKQLIFITLPNLQALNFATGVTTADDVYISNTDLRDLQGIELGLVDRWDVNNNKNLNMINVSNMTNVTTAMSFSANGANLNIMLPNLIAAANLTFRTAASVMIPSLYEVFGYVGFYNNNFQNVSAANLTRIAASFALVGSPDLTAFNFPSLNLVAGGVQVANNSQLDSITGFPKLARIGGAIDLLGTFDSASFPSLSDVRGGANIVTSSQNGTICNEFYTYHNNNVIAGDVDCLPNVSNGSTNGSSTGSSGKKNDASFKGQSLTMVATSVVGLAAAFLFL